MSDNIKNKVNQQIPPCPEFKLFIKYLINRLGTLSCIYCNSQIFEYEEYIKDFKTDIRVVYDDLKWKKIKSNSKVRKAKGESVTNIYKGWVGLITYSGNLSSYSALLSAGEILHVGSTTTFGLGKYSIESYE